MKIPSHIPIRLSFSLLFCLAILLSCKKESKKTFKNVLILGNSITKHPPAPEIGWYGDWGMAASAQEKDFVHLLIGKFNKENPSVKVNYKNISDFEGGYWQYNLSNLDSLKNLKPDLIILRIGENVNTGTIDEHQFKKFYSALIRYLRPDSITTKTVCVAGFWKNEPVEKIIKSCSSETNSTYVEISFLDDIQYMAWDEFSNDGIRLHPSDKGMSAIADAIWAGIIKL